MDRRFSIKHNNYHYLAAFISVAAVFVLTFVISFLASSILASVSESNATTTRVTLGNNYYIEVSASDIDLSLSTTPGGALAVAESNVVTKTNCNGYKLYLSSANTSPTVPIMNPHTHVVENVPTNSLILDGSSTTSGDWLPATPGEFTAAAGGPQAFRDSSHVNTNTWGFAVPSGSTGLPASAGAFDATYGTTAGGDVDYANKFAKVPLYTSPALIQSTSTADETGVDLDVYYGVYANMDNTAGDYSANVLYTVAAESPDVSASVSPSTTTALGGGDSLTITTPIFTSMPLTASDIDVTVGTASCPVTSITTTSSGNPDVLKITCSAPALSINTYNVTAAIPKLGQSFTITNGLTYSLGGTSITSISPNSMDEGDASSLATDIVISTDITATGLTASDLALTIGSTPIPASGLSFSYVDSKLAVTIDHTDADTITTLESLTADTYDVNLSVKGAVVAENDGFIVEAASLACPNGANRICFIANEPEGTVDGEMLDQTTVYLTSASDSLNTIALSNSTTELTLYSPNWTLSGYGFKGWNTKADGSGAMFGPNQTISISEGTLTPKMQTAIGDSGLALYAQWVASTGNLQDWSGCNSMNQGDVIALTDTRDNEVYAVAKLTDKHCWMIENLRYQGGGTSSDWSGTATDKQYDYTNLIGATANPTAEISYRNQYQWKSYGAYYSWAAAIDSTTSYTTTYGNPSSTTGSITGICPTSWRLPRSFYNSTASNANAEAPYLNYTLNGSYSSGSPADSSAWRTYPNNFVLSGDWGYSWENRGIRGYYWTSTVANYYANKNAITFYTSPTNRSSNAYNMKASEFPVRCVIGD